MSPSVDSNEAVILEIRNAVAWLFLNRPQAMNSINRAVCEQLAVHLRTLSSDHSVRVVVLTGTGHAFSAGADLKEVLEATDVAPGEPDLVDLMCDEVMAPLRSFPKPVIGALNGVTMAGGLELAMCCDMLVAAENAPIGDAHANFGVYPGAGGAAILPRIVPLNVAKYLLFTGNTLTAAQLQQFGLINIVTEAESLEAEVTALAQHIAEKSPIALQRMKEVANASMDGSRDAALQHEQVLFRRHLRSRDMQEGLAAFSEKRKPVFQGR